LLYSIVVSLALAMVLFTDMSAPAPAPQGVNVQVSLKSRRTGPGGESGEQQITTPQVTTTVTTMLDKVKEEVGGSEKEPAPCGRPPALPHGRRAGQAAGNAAPPGSGKPIAAPLWPPQVRRELANKQQQAGAAEPQRKRFVTPGIDLLGVFTEDLAMTSVSQLAFMAYRRAGLPGVVQAGAGAGAGRGKPGPDHP
jgi:hypothetical protein